MIAVLSSGTIPTNILGIIIVDYHRGLSQSGLSLSHNQCKEGFEHCHVLAAYDMWIIFRFLSIVLDS